MTLNERFLAVIEKEMGTDPTMGMLVTMFAGSLQSIPEDELRSHLEMYLKVLQGLLEQS